MIKSLFSKAEAVHWAFGLELALTSLSISELGAWLEWRAPASHLAFLDSGPALILAITGASLWGVSLLFAEKPRRWMLENLEIPLGAAMSLLVLPFMLAMLLDLIFGMSPMAWMSLWACAIFGGSFALALTASLMWGVMTINTATIAAACLIGTTAANELIGATSALGIALAAGSMACLVLAVGHLSESDQPARFTLWRAPAITRQSACSTSGLAWAFLLAMTAMIALGFDFVLTIAAPAALAAALYLYDGEGYLKPIILGLAMMALSVLLGIEAIGLDAYLIAGIGLSLMLVCTECGPALGCCAAGCLLMGACAPYVLEVELGRALSDPVLIGLVLTALGCLAALCYSRPDSMLISSFEVKLPNFLFLEEDFEWDEDCEYDVIDPRKESERV